MQPHGIEVRNLTKGAPGNGLPIWVRQAAEQRGYGDATAPLSLFITEDDVNNAFIEVAHGNGSACVMAQAGTRIGAKHVYFYRTTAWVDYGTGPIVRYQTSSDIWTHIIRPFDKGHRKSVRPGLYHLLPASDGKTLKAERVRTAKQKRTRQDEGGKSRPSTTPRPYMGRVVMANRGKAAS